MRRRGLNTSATLKKSKQQAMQDKNLKPKSIFLSLNAAKKQPETTQQGRILSTDNIPILIDNQALMSATETTYAYDSVKAFKKLDNKIKKLGH